MDIKKKSLKVALKGKGPEGVIIEGELPKEIKVNDSTWTLGALPSPADEVGLIISCTRRRQQGDYALAGKGEPADLVASRCHLGAQD